METLTKKDKTKHVCCICDRTEDETDEVIWEDLIGDWQCAECWSNGRSDE